MGATLSEALRAGEELRASGLTSRKAGLRLNPASGPGGRAQGTGPPAD